MAVPITLYVGDRNYSSWSLRPWLVLEWSGLAFDEVWVSLDQPGYGEGLVEAVARVSPSGRVPVLVTGKLTIWDSLAIAEWVAEQAPAACLWPQEPDLRAEARAVCCEMHAGFQALRRDLPMNLRRRCRVQSWSRDTQLDLDRMQAMWRHYRARHESQGPYLFGERSIADAFFTPVATRLRTYSVPLDPLLASYCETLLGDRAFRAWEARALQEWQRPFSRAPLDSIYAGSDV